MNFDLVSGLFLTIAGAATIVDRHGMARRVGRRVRFWSSVRDVEADAFDYGVLGWIFVGLGVVILILRPFAKW